MNKVLREDNGQQFDRGEFEEDRASLWQIIRHLEEYQNKNFPNPRYALNDNGKTYMAIETCISCIKRAMRVFDNTGGFNYEDDFPVHWWADNYDEKGDLIKDNDLWSDDDGHYPDMYDN